MASKTFDPTRVSSFKIDFGFYQKWWKVGTSIKTLSLYRKYFYSGSFGSSLIESSISLNRFTQPINKVIANKKSPHLIGSLIQTSKMKYSSPDKNWNQPPNSVENYNIKRDLYQYLSDTNQLKDRLPNSFIILRVEPSPQNSMKP